MATLDRPVAHALIVAAVVIGLAVRAWFVRRAHRGSHRIDGASATLGVVVIVVPALACLTDVLAFADYRFGAFVAVVGAFLLVAAGGLYVRAHRDLAKTGDAWTACGAYARVRHPIDAALWLGCFAQALLVANWIAGPAPLVAFAVLHALRVRRAEASMLARFGLAYRDYMSRTDRLLPGVW